MINDDPCHYTSKPQANQLLQEWVGLSAVCIISSLLNSSLVLAFAHRASFSRRFKLERNEEEAASSAAMPLLRYEVSGCGFHREH